MDEYSYELKIPLNRVAVLIGKSGSVKKEIESITKTSLDIDSKEGEVIVTGEDALGMFSAREVIKAIGRGFNPDFAQQLLKGDYVLEIVDVSEYTGKSKNKMLRMKGRVIGSEGKSRKMIEKLTETYISVFGKTIGIIGKAENVYMAKKAVDSLLSGSPHSNVYRWLERQRVKLKRDYIFERKIV